MRDAVAVQVADLLSVHAEAPLAALAHAGLHSGPGGDCLCDLVAVSHCAKIEVQVNLKSSAHDQRSLEAERRCLLRAALLRGARPDPLGSSRLRSPALRAAGAAADRLH